MGVAGDDELHFAAAQAPKTKPLWQERDGGPRTPEDAREFARANQIHIDDDVQFVVGDACLRDEDYASYAGFRSNRMYSWEDLLLDDVLLVKVRAEVLASDEAILCVFAHEMHEINELRRMFDELERIPGHRLIALTEAGRPGNLHDQAWDVGDRAVNSFRRLG